jgi:glycine oxidase
MSGGPTVMIAGAGVLGLTTALALADAGCVVTVCDPGGSNASNVAAGMIAPVFEAVLDPAAREDFDLLLAARDLWPALAQRAGIALDRCGAVAVGTDGWLDVVVGGFGTLGVMPTEISAETAVSLTPGLVLDGRHALMTREDWHVDARSAMGALGAAASSAGVVFRQGFIRDHQTDILVLATGAHANTMAPELARLNPIKGHIVRIAASTFGAVIRSDGVYVTPGAGTAFGATMEPGRSDTTVEVARFRPLLEAGLRLFPGLAGLPVEATAGVRAATPDGLPMVGPSTRPGLLLAVGARRNGWLLAPLVAQIITAYVTGRDAGPYAARLDPARFTEG